MIRSTTLRHHYDRGMQSLATKCPVHAVCMVWHVMHVWHRFLRQSRRKLVANHLFHVPKGFTCYKNLKVTLQIQKNYHLALTVSAKYTENNQPSATINDDPAWNLTTKSPGNLDVAVRDFTLSEPTLRHGLWSSVRIHTLRTHARYHSLWHFCQKSSAVISSF